MGVPDGWVTDVPGLSRNEQLKALGNGVVPQQAAAALRVLLEGQHAPVAPVVTTLPTPAATDVGRNRDLVNRAATGSQMELGDVVRSIGVAAPPLADDGMTGELSQLSLDDIA